MYCKKYEGYKKEKFYFDLTRCIKKSNKKEEQGSKNAEPGKLGV